MNKEVWWYEMVAAAVIGVFCTYFLIETYTYGPKAALFPRLICFFVLFLSVIFFVSRIRRFLKMKALSASETQTKKQDAESHESVKWFLTFGLAIGFCILMTLIGFGPAAVCYLALHSYMAGYRKIKVILIVALIVAAAMVLFGRMFNIPLPEGILFEMMM